MFFNPMWSRPKAETTTLSSQTATGPRDIKSLSFLPKRDRSRAREEEEKEEEAIETLRVASLQGYEVLLGV